MLIGEYNLKLDAKRRLPMPAKLRHELGTMVVITRGLDQCLFVYSANTWAEFADKVNKLPISQESGRSFARLIFSGAVETELDKLGRVLIPDYLKEHAGLEKEAIIIGAGNRLEVWDKERWAKYQVKGVENMGEDAAGLKEFGL